MSRRMQLLVAGLGLLLLVVAWFFLLWRPQSSAVKSARTAVASATASQTKLEGELAVLRVDQRALPSERATLGRSLAALPVSTSVPALIDQVNDDTLSTGVSWTQDSQTLAAADSSTAGVTLPPGAEAISLNFTVQGTYPQVRAFLDKLDTQPRLVVVSSLTYSSSGRSLSVTITAEAFYDPTAPTGTLTGTTPSSDAST